MTRYFIRVNFDKAYELEVYLATRKAKYNLVSNHIGITHTVLYSSLLDRQEAVALKLSIPVIGMMEQPHDWDANLLTSETHGVIMTK